MALSYLSLLECILYKLGLVGVKQWWAAINTNLSYKAMRLLVFLEN
jgi:hypothetical protein